MQFTGYHGTTEESAKEIEKTKKFVISSGDKEWLGHGIYFYKKYRDAKQWCIDRNYENHAVLIADVEIEKEKILDLTKKWGKAIFEAVKEVLSGMGIVFQKKHIQENQCATMNYIWDTYPQYEMCIAEFPTRKNLYSTLTDGREKRIEFCVRDNKYITKIERHK